MGIVQTKISRQYFFLNGDLLLHSISTNSKNGNGLQTEIEKWLNNSYCFKDTIHQKKGNPERAGYSADSVNKQLRLKMREHITGIHGESFVEYGSIVSVSKKGFDFCIYDEEYYTKKIRNAFIGNPGQYNGDEKLEKIHAKIKKSNDKCFSADEWKKTIQEIRGTPGENLDICKKSYTVAGEIQMGNWAMIRHDFIRLLNSERDGEIDFYIYITPDGNLKSMLSDQIVSYENAKEFFCQNIRLVHTPIWLIGIDLAT